MEEVFDCLRMGKPKVCVPALLTVLDGFLAEHLVRKQIMPANKTNVAKYLKTFDSTEETRPVTTWWMSAVNFVESLFETTDFRTDAPTFINRHWILHGRAKTNWSMIDALKLLNALATLHSIVTEDLWPEVIDPGTAEPN